MAFGERVFKGTTMKKGNIALAPEELGRRMDRNTYRTHLHNNLRDLSMEACRKVIYDWGRFDTANFAAWV